jgi:hypothetical protein
MMLNTGTQADGLRAGIKAEQERLHISSDVITGFFATIDFPILILLPSIAHCWCEDNEAGMVTGQSVSDGYEILLPFCG